VHLPAKAPDSEEEEEEEEEEQEEQEEHEEHGEHEEEAPSDVAQVEAEPEGGDDNKPVSVNAGGGGDEVPASANSAEEGGDMDKRPSRPKAQEKDSLVFEIGCGTAVIHAGKLGVVAYGPDSSGRSKLRWEDGSISGFVVAKELLPPSQAEAAVKWVTECWVLGRVAPG
jgi:hypothetical protein